MKLIIPAATFFFLSACAHDLQFSKPGASNSDFKREWTKCKARAGQAGIYGGDEQREFLRDCMEGEGWKFEK